MALALGQLNPIHKKGPKSFFFYINPPFYRKFWYPPRGLVFGRSYPSPLIKGGEGGTEEGGSNYQATDKKVELQQDKLLEGSKFHIMGQGYYK